MLSFIEEEASVFEEEMAGKQAVINCADISALIQNLSSPDNDNDDYIKQFLTTFRYFISPSAFLKKLIFRFSTCEDSPNSKKPQMRMLDVIKLWIREHYYDFESDPDLLRTLQTFVQNTLASSKNCSDQVDLINKNILKQMNKDSVTPIDMSVKRKISKFFERHTRILDYTPNQLANQLTLLNFERFKLVKPLELYNNSWSKDDTKMVSPNVVALINQFNKISQWIQAEILTEKNVKKRSEVLKHFIDVAWCCYGYRDYETVFTIAITLANHTITRLGNTWAHLDKNTKKQWQKIEDFASFKSNYKNYRHHLRRMLKSGGSVMPYFGLFLKDLAFIEENKTMVRIGAVNFHKMRMVANIISDIQKLQYSIFNFKKDIKLLTYLSYELPNYDEDTLYEMSKQCEFVASRPGGSIGRKSVFGTLLRSPSASGQQKDAIVKVMNPIYGYERGSQIKKSLSSVN